MFLWPSCAKELYLNQDLDCVPINLSKIEIKSVKIEQFLLLIYNFTYVVSVKWSTSQMHIFEKNWKTCDCSRHDTTAIEVKQITEVFIYNGNG